MTEAQLDAASIRAVGPIYAAAMLEELRLFDVMDRLVSLYQSGRLPIRRGGAEIGAPGPVAGADGGGERLAMLIGASEAPKIRAVARSRACYEETHLIRLS